MLKYNLLLIQGKEMAEAQVYFLSDANDNHGGRFRNDIDVWSSRIQVAKKSENRAKSFSTMMASCGIFLYDHPEAMKKYPNGFYSENMIFVPIDMYERAAELEPLAAKLDSANSYWNLTGLILIPFFTKMIEQKYDISFSDEEKEKILLSATENSFLQKTKIVGRGQIDFEYKLNSIDDSNEIINQVKEEEVHYLSMIGKVNIKNFANEIFNGKEPIFLSNKDICLFAEENNLLAAKTFKKQTSDTSFLDYALLKNKDMYEKGHPFNQLMGEVKMPSKTIDLLHLDKDNYKDIIHNITFAEGYILFNAFENLTHKIFNESKTTEDLIRNISGIWSNLAVETNDNHFEVLMNILHDNCLQKFPSEENQRRIEEDMMFKIGKSINKNPSTTRYKREILIDGLTRYSDDCSTVRTMFYPTKTKKQNMK